MSQATKEATARWNSKKIKIKIQKKIQKKKYRKKKLKNKIEKNSKCHFPNFLPQNAGHPVQGIKKV